MKAYEIAYAYPTSPNAEHLGFGKTGCYYVQETYIREDESVSADIAHNCEGFADENDPDLVSLLKEYQTGTV